MLPLVALIFVFLRCLVNASFIHTLHSLASALASSEVPEIPMVSLAIQRLSQWSVGLKRTQIMFISAATSPPSLDVFLL